MGYEKRIKQRLMKLCDIPHKSGKGFDIEVEEQERLAIAERLQFPAINRLHLQGTVSKLADMPIYRIGGAVTAEITLCCVMTMEEFAYSLQQDLDWDVSADPHYRSDGNGEASTEQPEFSDTGIIDVVEYAVQTIGLHVPTYPRRPGADNQWQTASSTADMVKKGWLTFNEPAHENAEQKHNPFSVLADLQKRKNHIQQD